MVEYNTEYFENGVYFFLKDKKDKIDLYYTVAETITESRKKDEKKEFPKKSENLLKNYISKILKNKKKRTKKEIDADLEKIKKSGEIDELVDSDGTLSSSRVPFLNMYLTPKKTMDQTVPMARVSNDPVTRGYRVYWGESKDSVNNLLNEDKLSTMEKLILQAEKDGHIKGDYSQNVLSSAKKIAKEFDNLKNDEERKSLKDYYYDKFIKMIGKKKNIKEVDYSDAFGYDETEDKDFKGTVNTLKKMGVENPVERAKQFGKLPKAKKKNGMLRQRLSEKDSIEEEQKKRMEKMVEDILTKRYQDDSEVVEKESGINKILMKNLQSIKKLAEKEGISVSQLIKMLKNNE